MAYSSKLVSYLGQGLLADRPAEPYADVDPTGLALYFANDTGELALYNADQDAWVTLFSNLWPEIPEAEVAALPAAPPRCQIYLATDEVGGAVLVFWDGADWRRVTDRAVAST